jgi:hypothetical protein
MICKEIEKKLLNNENLTQEEKRHLKNCDICRKTLDEITEKKLKNGLFYLKKATENEKPSENFDKELKKKLSETSVFSFDILKKTILYVLIIYTFIYIPEIKRFITENEKTKNKILKYEFYAEKNNENSKIDYSDSVIVYKNENKNSLVLKDVYDNEFILMKNSALKAENSVIYHLKGKINYKIKFSGFKIKIKKYDLILLPNTGEIIVDSKNGIIKNKTPKLYAIIKGGNKVLEYGMFKIQNGKLEKIEKENDKKTTEENKRKINIDDYLDSENIIKNIGEQYEKNK